MLWLLRPRDFLPDDDNPWNPWYDKCFGFVIRADSEEDARQIADVNSGSENDNTFLGRTVCNTSSPWMDPKYSSCTELSDIGPAKMIMRDYHAA